MDTAPTPAGVTIDLFPSHPIWRGILINSVVFGAVVWLGMLALRVSARQFRADRGASRALAGLCVACAYPLHDLPVCPECGLAREKPSPEQPTSDGAVPPEFPRD